MIIIDSSKTTITAYAIAIDDTLGQDQIDDIEEDEMHYLIKIYNSFNIQMEACCTVITCWENIKCRQFS